MSLSSWLSHEHVLKVSHHKIYSVYQLVSKKLL